MSPAMGATDCVAGPVAAVTAGIESLTNQSTGTTMYLTTPPTPLNDAHQGGYFLGIPSPPVRHLVLGT